MDAHSSIRSALRPTSIHPLGGKHENSAAEHGADRDERNGYSAQRCALHRRCARRQVGPGSDLRDLCRGLVPRQQRALDGPVDYSVGLKGLGPK
jgi:hypothetical protein